MKLQVAILAVMLFLAIGLYLYINPVKRMKPLFQKSVDESVVPHDSNNDERPTPQRENRPDRNPPVRSATIVVVLRLPLTPALHTVDNEI